jgi:hypothetical protein
MTEERRELIIQIYIAMLSSGYYHEAISKETRTPGGAIDCLVEMARVYADAILQRLEQDEQED